MPVAPGAPPQGGDIAIRAWNLMGGLDWQALPAIAEMFGITDIETFIAQLAAIRDWQHSQTETD